MHPFHRRGPSVRSWSWFGLGSVMALDAMVASGISLGLLYFVPLVYAANRLRRGEALLFALVCTAGRVLFGPTGDPLGLQELTFRVPGGLESLINGSVALFAYAAVAGALAKLREQKRRIQRLDRQVETDPLTGVTNRRGLERVLAEAAAAGTEVAVLALDVDRFKSINDTFGHHGGDQVLRELAARLELCIRRPDVVARAGGEEFMVVLPGTSLQGALRVADRIWTRVRETPFAVQEGSLHVTVSIGCAQGAPGPELLAAADAAMYRAKQTGRDRIELAKAA